MKRSQLLIVGCVLGLRAFASGMASETSEIKYWSTPHGNGIYSAAAQNVCKVSTSTSGDEIWSPNHLLKIVIRHSPEGDTTLFAIDEGGHEFAIETAEWPCPEVGWSPASDLIFATYSDGGNVGTYHVSTYRLSAGKLTKLDLTTAVRRDFTRGYPRCFSPEEPNIAAIAWSADSTRLLVAAEVLPHSNCEDMGTFKLYVVSIATGAIINRISQLVAKQSFYHLLGPELREAEDSCFLKPGSCRIPALHQPSKRW